MIKSLAYVFFAFMALAFLTFLISSAQTAFSSLVPKSTAFSISIPGSMAMAGSVSRGLTAVDFSQFAKNGSGWAYITQGYGYTPSSFLYINHWHNGIDIAADYGADIFSADDGTVVATGNQDNYCPARAFGRFAVIRDAAHNVNVLYAHLGAIYINPGDAVHKGQKIATVGSSGLETGPHLHLSVYEDEGFVVKPAYGCGPYPLGKDVNPIPYLENL